MWFFRMHAAKLGDFSKFIYLIGNSVSLSKIAISAINPPQMYEVSKGYKSIKYRPIQNFGNKFLQWAII